jgi:hypothetical protein
LRLVPRKVRLGLAQSYVKRPGVNDSQELARLNILAFFEVHLNQLSVDTTLHCHGVECRHGPQAVQINRQILPRRRGDHNWYGTAATATTAGGSPGRAATRRASLCRCGSLRLMSAAPHKHAAYDCRDNQQEDNPTLPGTFCDRPRIIGVEINFPVGCTFSK